MHVMLSVMVCQTSESACCFHDHGNGSGFKKKGGGICSEAKRLGKVFCVGGALILPFHEVRDAALHIGVSFLFWFILRLWTLHDLRPC
jgi:hypothetical protein